MIKVKVNNEYKDVVKIFGGATLQKEITKVWSREAQEYVYESSVEYTGTLPITINADGNALIDYRIYGDDGGVGERTENLWSKDEVARIQVTSDDSAERYGMTFSGSVFSLCLISDSILYYKIKNNDTYGMATQLSVGVVRTITLTDNQTLLVYGENLTMVQQAIIQINSGTSYIPYGYKLPMVVHSELKDIGDTVSVNGALWDIVDYNDDFTRATLLRHETMSEMMYGAKQAIFAFPNGLAAGNYHFTIAQHPWILTDVGKTLTFTLTQAIPEGGQLVFNGTYNATLVGTTISSYASPTTTTAIETVTMTEGDSGTNLGSLTNAGTPASNINSLQKALLGSNEWKTSAQRQYLNSDKAAGSVWAPQTIYDRPPAWATNTAGFMVGLDEDFLSCVADTTYVTVRNTVSDGGGTDTLTDKFYLPSRTEIFGNDEVANTPEGTLYQYYVNATNADRIKYRANTARSWRLRTPYAAIAIHVRYVNNTGALSNYYAGGALGFAPACQIDLTNLSNSWLQNNMYKVRATTIPVYIGENQLDADEYVSYGEQKIYRDVSGTLTPTDPPVPLPDISTIKGKTIINYDGTPKPSQMYVKYRR